MTKLSMPDAEVVAAEPMTCADDNATMGETHRDGRWPVLALACAGVLMDTLNGTIADLALPSIRIDLGISDHLLSWAVNGYMVAFGGCLLLGGRLGDTHGHPRTLLHGIALFTCGSLVCGIAGTLGWLIAGRAIQGVGAAAILATALPIVLQLFNSDTHRIRALAIYSGVVACSGSVGLMIGGVLTDALGWRWIFFFNFALGAVLYLLGTLYLRGPARPRGKPISAAAATSVTSSLSLATFSFLTATTLGAGSLYTWGSAAAALICATVFVSLETQSVNRTIPPKLLRDESLMLGTAIAALQNASVCIWFFICSLQLQRVVGYRAATAGLAFLPATVMTAGLGLGIAEKVIARVGAKRTLIASLALIAIALTHLARMPVAAGFVADVLPGMLLMGVGSTLAYGAVTVISMKEVEECDYGVASGVMSSVSVLSGSISLALASTLAASRSDHLLSSGSSLTVSLGRGYGLALLIAAICTVMAMVASVWIKPSSDYKLSNSGGT